MAERREPTRRFLLPPGMEPRYLSRDEAAAYLGVSADTFDDEVATGQWPQARRRGTKGTRLTWDRRVLDAYADLAAGMPVPAISPRQGPPDLPDEAPAISVPLGAQPKLTAEEAALKGLSNASPRNRPKYRQPSPS